MERQSDTPTPDHPITRTPEHLNPRNLYNVQSVSEYTTIQNKHTGETLKMQRVREASGLVYLTLEGSLPSGAKGPPLHKHVAEVEEGTVAAGTLGATVNGKKVVIPAGGSAAFPNGVVHAWWNEGEDTLLFNGRATPVVDLDKFLQALFAVINSGPKGKPPPMFYLAHVLWRHRRTQVITVPPVPVQRIVFPAVLLVGHLLGKYRGQTWPGAPSSCPGAPEVASGT
jgi:quercetin dioxygenase-like cupin family protein